MPDLDRSSPHFRITDASTYDLIASAFSGWGTLKLSPHDEGGLEISTRAENHSMLGFLTLGEELVEIGEGGDFLFAIDETQLSTIMSISKRENASEVLFYFDPPTLRIETVSSGADTRTDFGDIPTQSQHPLSRPGLDVQFSDDDVDMSLFRRAYLYFDDVLGSSIEENRISIDLGEGLELRSPAEEKEYSIPGLSAEQEVTTAIDKSLLDKATAAVDIDVVDGGEFRIYEEGPVGFEYSLDGGSLMYFIAPRIDDGS